jgi:hypothetical protein
LRLIHVFRQLPSLRFAAPASPKATHPRFPGPSNCLLPAGCRVAAPFKRSSLPVETAAVPASTRSTAPYKCRVLIKEALPDPNAPQGPLTLNIADAIRRGLRFNLGAISANASVKQLRGERLAALSKMLPNIYGTLSENGAKIDLATQGLRPARSAAVFHSQPRWDRSTTTARLPISARTSA